MTKIMAVHDKERRVPMIQITYVWYCLGRNTPSALVFIAWSKVGQHVSVWLGKQSRLLVSVFYYYYYFFYFLHRCGWCFSAQGTVGAYIHLCARCDSPRGYGPGMCRHGAAMGRLSAARLAYLRAEHQLPRARAGCFSLTIPPAKQQAVLSTTVYSWLPGLACGEAPPHVRSQGRDQKRSMEAQTSARLQTCMQPSSFLPVQRDATRTDATYTRRCSPYTPATAATHESVHHTHLLHAKGHTPEDTALCNDRLPTRTATGRTHRDAAQPHRSGRPSGLPTATQRHGLCHCHQD